jgi:CubicO group peptidase (beta-lactamase class C family)
VSRFTSAVSLAQANPSAWPEDIRDVIEGGTFDHAPWNIVKGPVARRGGPAGAVLIGNRLEAAWGELDRADMIFSVTKSYIGFLAGLALDRELIPSFDVRVAESADHEAFASPRNRCITWRQLLQQTSEWHGTLWGIPDSVDRDRQLSLTDDATRFGRNTPLQAPGTYWDYNDARVNALCLALTVLFRAPLGEVLADALPSFATAHEDWWWRGYGAESEIEIDGRRIEVVVGGGHWGGGLRSSVPQDLLLGRAVRDAGWLGGRQVISETSLDQLLAPCPLQPVYGGLWWLNTGRTLVPEAPVTSVFATGVGMNAIWIDRPRDLVAVVRWIDEAAYPSFVNEVMSALE